jgi:hypothetical protein
MDLNALVDLLKRLLQNEELRSINSQVAFVKKTFETKYSMLLDQKKSQFLKDGGALNDFFFSNPSKAAFVQLMTAYKKRKKAHFEALEVQMKANLDKRIALIEQLKQIIEKADFSSMYNEFKALQAAWKSIGPVPRTKYNTTWRNYHHHVSRFYDLLHLNKDLRELDFKHNLEEKLKLLERVELLSKEEDVVSACRELQVLHKKWREDIGPVSKEHREVIWEQFRAATKKIHDKKEAFYQSQKANYELNLASKLAIVEQLENFEFTQNSTHRNWQQSIKEFEAIRESFFQIGKVPPKKSQFVWERLKASTKNFNQAKNSFYKDLNRTQQANLKKKRALVALAKSLKDSQDYKHAAAELKRIQSEWKTIGHVPRKFADKIWKEFSDSCNCFFKKDHSLHDLGSHEEQEALKTKRSFLKQIGAVFGNPKLDVEEVRAYIDTWRQIGPVPKKEKSIENDFKKALGTLCDQLGVEEEESALLRYQCGLSSRVLTDSRLLNTEIQSARDKVEQLTKEITQLQNNINFIANSDDENPLLKEVNASIDQRITDLSLWKRKLKYLRGQQG